MPAGKHYVLCDLLKTHGVCDKRSGELCGIKNTSFKSKINFAAGKRSHRNTHFLKNIGSPANSSYLHSGKLFDISHGVFSKETHLLTGISAHERLQTEVSVQLISKCHSTAFHKPYGVFDIIQTKRNGSKSNKALVLSFPVSGPVMPHFHNAVSHSVKHLEGRNKSAIRENLDLKLTVRNLFNGFSEMYRCVVPWNTR